MTFGVTITFSHEDLTFTGKHIEPSYYIIDLEIKVNLLLNFFADSFSIMIFIIDNDKNVLKKQDSA
jgi:hypothetical protein